MVRRWDLLFSLLGAAVALAVVLAGGGLLSLVLVTQGMLGFQMVRNRLLCRRVQRISRVVFRGVSGGAAVRALWPTAWRTAAGGAGIAGLNQATGVLFAQFGEPAAVASYLLALKFFDVASRLSRAPFYSRLPILARLRAQARNELHLELARRGMRWSYWLFVAAVQMGMIAGPYFFRAVGSSVPFPSSKIWLTLGFALLLERFGAMHLQLAGTANRIVAHTAMGGYVVIHLAALALLAVPLGIHAFPLAMLAGYLGWYAWYCARESYRALGLEFWGFERNVFMPPLAVTMLLAAARSISA